MNKALIEIYGLAVCFIATTYLPIFSGISLYSMAEIAFPQIMQIPPPFLPPLK
jgi:hypothetical protein